MTISTISTKNRKVKVQEHESIINNAPKLHATFEPGDVAHQGDVIVVCIESLPESAMPRANRQLAEGTTQGSRHVLTHGKVYDCNPAEVVKAIKKVTGCDIGKAFVGPVFVSPECPTANDLAHPEHGSQGFPSEAVCAIVYQRNLDAEQRETRVRD
jgi:hypothetical protein